MKHLLFVVLDNKKETNDLVHSLSKKGINGTVLNSTSLKHVIQDEDEDTPSFFSLAHLSENRLVHNTTIYFLLEDNEVEKVKNEVRTFTKNFTIVKGGMFSTPVDSYEGSF